MNLAAKILENKQEDQVATQIPLRGELTDPDVDLVTTIVNLLRNAFVAAFSHSLEGSINLRDVATDVRCLSGEPPAAEQPDDEHRAGSAGAISAERYAALILPIRVVPVLAL